jgi:hypothetical protein
VYFIHLGRFLAFFGEKGRFLSSKVRKIGLSGASFMVLWRL